MDLLGGLSSKDSETADSADGRSGKVRMVRQPGPEGNRNFTEGERELLRKLAKSNLQIHQCGPINVGTKKSMDALTRAQTKLREEQSLDGPSIQERHGAAHYHVWNALVGVARDMAPADSKEKKIIDRYLESIRSVKDYMPEVQVCKV